MNRAHSRSRLKNPPANLVTPFSPDQLFSNGEKGAWYDPSDMASLFQDAAGTIPVTAADQPVGLVVDKSGRGNNASQATAASRPILRNSGALWWLEFDGIDDGLQTASIDFTSTDKMSIFSGVRKASDAATAVLVELSISNTANNGTFRVTAPQGVAATYGLAIRANPGIAGDVGYSFPGFISPVTSILAMQIDFAGALAADEASTRINGLTPAPTISGLASAGVGNFGNYVMYIGRRAGASLPFTGNLYGMIIRGVATPLVITGNTERYLADKSGVIL